MKPHLAPIAVLLLGLACVLGVSPHYGAVSEARNSSVAGNIAQTPTRLPQGWFISPAEAACGSGPRRVVECGGGAPPFVPRLGNIPANIFGNCKTSSFHGLSGVSALANTRSTVAYEDDASGNWNQFGIGVTRSTGKGCLIESVQRTNSLRTSDMTGAVAGSPGTLPNNWTQTSAPTGLTRTITLGSSIGFNSITINWTGTATSTAQIVLAFETANNIAAAYGQTWTGGVFAAVTSSSGVTVVETNVQGTNGVSQTETTASSNFVAQSTLARVSVSGTLANSGTTNVRSTVFTNSIASTTVLNFTVVIILPQLENNSDINSTLASAVKAADGTGGVNGTAVYQVGGGTGPTAAQINVTWAAGVMTVNSVANIGNYTTFPPSPAALTYVSGTATGWTGATVNLTPTSNANQAYPTSPIPTTSAAVTRAADAVTISPAPVYGNAQTIYARGTFNTPTAYGADNQYPIAADDGTATNQLLTLRASNSGQAFGEMLPNFVALGPSAAAWPQSASRAVSMSAATAGNSAASFAGTSLGTSATAGPAGSALTNTRLGNGYNAASPAVMYLEQFGIWLNYSGSQAGQNALTK